MRSRGLLLPVVLLLLLLATELTFRSSPSVEASPWKRATERPTGLEHLNTSLASDARNVTRHRLKKCGPEKDHYCANGGICYIQPEIGKEFCWCPEDFTGERCLHRVITRDPNEEELVQDQSQSNAEPLPRDFFDLNK